MNDYKLKSKSGEATNSIASSAVLTLRDLEKAIVMLEEESKRPRIVEICYGDDLLMLYKREGNLVRSLARYGVQMRRVNWLLKSQVAYRMSDGIIKIYDFNEEIVYEIDQDKIRRDTLGVE